MKIFFILPLFFCFTSCKLKEKASPTKVWLFAKVDFPETNDDMPTDIVRDVAIPLNFTPESFLNIQKDGKFTSFFGRFVQGTWKQKANKLYLADPNGSNIGFEIKELDDKTLTLYYKSRHALYKFNGYANDFVSDAENPFAYGNNKWRRKALAPETDEQIVDRLKNHFRFFEKYFKWGLKVKKSMSNVGIISGPLEIYSSGFGLKPVKEQPYEWRNLFYDSTDCKKAYTKIYNLFQNEDLEWKPEEGSFRMLSSAFQQLQKKIEQKQPGKQ